MDDETLKISTTTDGRPAEPGHEKAGAPKPINPVTGQHGAYWVLSEDERKKGFCRPVRDSYVHVGPPGPTHALRDLTHEEKERFSEHSYTKFEAYKHPQNPSVTGRFWTQAQLDKAGKGCGAKTTMSRPIAETYARDPKYYGATFCCACRTHLPVDEFRWPDGTTLGS